MEDTSYVWINLSELYEEENLKRMYIQGEITCLIKYIGDIICSIAGYYHEFDVKTEENLKKLFTRSI